MQPLGYDDVWHRRQHELLGPNDHLQAALESLDRDAVARCGHDLGSQGLVDGLAALVRKPLPDWGTSRFLKRRAPLAPVSGSTITIFALPWSLDGLRRARAVNSADV